MQEEATDLVGKLYPELEKNDPNFQPPYTISGSGEVSGAIGKELVLQHISKRIEYYDTKCKELHEPDEKIKEIASLVTDLERMQPYRDYNTRTFTGLVLNRELVKNNMSPCVFDDPTIVKSGISADELVDVIQKGQTNFLALAENGKLRGTDPELIAGEETMLINSKQQFQKIERGDYIKPDNSERLLNEKEQQAIEALELKTESIQTDSATEIISAPLDTPPSTPPKDHTTLPIDLSQSDLSSENDRSIEINTEQKESERLTYLEKAVDLSHHQSSSSASHNIQSSAHTASNTRQAAQSSTQETAIPEKVKAEARQIGDSIARKNKPKRNVEKQKQLSDRLAEPKTKIPKVINDTKKPAWKPPSGWGRV